MRKVLLLLGIVATSVAAWAQSDARPKILVLGTYHMPNLGRDIYTRRLINVDLFDALH